jgi:L-aspartate oxidase
MTGHNIQTELVENAKNNSNIRILENVIVIDLLIKKGTCVGVEALDIFRNRIIEIFSDITVLATGGIGQLYSKTSNPVIATGDGLAMAWRAGAILRDLEFIQFHPTILDRGGSPYFLISESVRGEGGVLINSEREAFMTRYHPLQDLAPRDVVSRAIVEEQKKGQVYLDVRGRGKEFLENRFPGIYEECLRWNIRMEKDLIPVSPAAHYFCGGVKTDLNTHTNIPGLLVIGETAFTGVHGANRMASNSLLECLVFSDISSNQIDKNGNSFPEILIGEKLPKFEDSSPLKERIQQIMWEKVGINRDLENLEKALIELERIYQQAQTQLEEQLTIQNIETRNLACIARLTTKAAHTRRESRGTHMLNDFSTRDDVNWQKHINFEKENMFLVDHKK